MASRLRPRALARRARAREEMLVGPIRGELLGAEHLGDRARALAAGQRVARAGTGRRKTPLLERLDSTRGILDRAHARLTETAAKGGDISPAGEWLLDNYHVIEEQIQEVRASLPAGYYRELPELVSGPLAGYPRAYELAITLISHTEARIDLDNVTRFVSEFQRVTTLSMGELWAIPAMLRLGLIESVRRMTLRTVERLDEIERAIEWADRFRAGAARGSPLESVLGEFVQRHPPLTPTFVARLLQLLHTESGHFPGIERLEQWLAQDGLTLESAAAQAIQRLALTQLMMTNSITSLRAVARLDWRSVVEGQSRTEAVLRDDPSGFYARMTFATRDRYRHAVERIARGVRSAEETVAKVAVDLARGAQQADPTDGRRSHVGYYLVDEGLRTLESAVGYRPTPGELVNRWIHDNPNVTFVGGLLAGTALFLAMLWLLIGGLDRREWLVVVLFSFLPANDIAVNVLNQLITAFLPPRLLSKLDLHAQGVPPEYRTAVVSPNLFEDVEAVRRAVEMLEVRFLANRGAHLHFAILGDFTDSPTETAPGDDEIIATATEGVEALNARYAPDTKDVFFFFHRPRQWNPQQGVWMGWERKRGKLAQFNRFVQAGDRSGFSVVVGNVAPLREVKYVITLDADTVLPPDAAPDLIGAIGHPLNRAEYDPTDGRVVRGYGILQPRIGVSLPSAYQSRFAAIYSDRPGVDPYTTAVSDVYQDLYGEGSFTGKGIYDVQAFETATHGRFPENRLLSHDLIEGNYARTALVTDVNLYDDYPRTYLSYTRRKHRWIRGDWQIIQWLAPAVPGPDGLEPNRLSVLSRWKILDNLRRSTVEPAQFAFIVAGWTLLPGSPLRWTLFGLGAIAIPWLLATLLAVVRLPFDKSWRAYFGAVGLDVIRSAKQVGLAIVFLPHQAWISMDAIVRTLWRLFGSHRRLLEWQTASATERETIDTQAATWRAMTPAIAMVGVVATILARRWITANPAMLHWPAALGPITLLALWAISPVIAYSLSAPAVRPAQRLHATARRRAFRYALLHWRYFDRFVGPDTHWLAPDNFQDDPTPVTAMRTSPTNIGLQLLATVSAYDLGFVSLEAMILRLERAFATLDRLARFRGHFFNWYNLTDLSILEPAYVSSVDSGNLAGHLVALRQACLTIPDERPVPGRVARAVGAALGIAEQRITAVAGPRSRLASGAREALARAAKEVSELRQTIRSEIESDRAALASHVDQIKRLVALLESSGLPAGEIEPVKEWLSWGARVIEERARTDRTGPSTLREDADQSSSARELVDRLEALAERAYRRAMEMDFRFLLDRERKLLSVGYHVASHSRDTSWYDLLASEARLASFIAIAKSDAPVEHWFRLARTLTYAAGGPAMVSWSGSMFEYLMPALVMRSYPFTLLDQTYHGAVRRQIAYGGERGVPWGISESAYNVRDREFTYQYRAFGVPDLALKRGLGRDLVVAPYASALAAMVEPNRALGNLATIERLATLGPYGFRDAIDYTRPDKDSDHAVVKTYMAHHVGMSLVALTNAITYQIWPRRFHADPLVRSAELLLHERIPRQLVLRETGGARAGEFRPEPSLDGPTVREIDTPDTPEPHIALLGRPPLTLMISHCGAGYSRYEELAIARWRSDGTKDETGQFCYVKDVSRNRMWSATYQPSGVKANRYRATLANDRVTIDRADGDIETRTEIAVVPDDAAEVRRVTVINNGSEPRELELTSYGELVLAPPDADRAHPAFGNLFVETEWHDWCTAVTAVRRPRSVAEPTVWCVHVVATDEDRVGPISCETDRARFLGRGRSVREPVALESDGPLSGTTGAVLDPIFALRARVRIRPGQSATVAFTTLIATSRERAFELADRYHDPHAAQRALDLAWTSTQVELRELGLSLADATVFQELAGHLFYGNPLSRAPQSELRRHRGEQTRLWAHGISGDWPIVLATIGDQEGMPTLRQILAAHRYWRRRGMTVDLVILNTRPTTYHDELETDINGAIHAVNAGGLLDRPGGLFLRRADRLGADDVALIRVTSRLLVDCDGRPLGGIAQAPVPSGDDSGVAAVRPRRSERSALPAYTLPWRLLSGLLSPERPRRRSGPHAVSPAAPDSTLTFDNGFGGMTADGEYEIRVAGDRLPPAPWVNVVANPAGGFIVSERGTGFAWARNSHFFRLTEWSNDPVVDPATEAIYLRDEDNGAIWCPTPAPVPTDLPYIVRHAPGASRFRHEHDHIATDLRVGLDPKRAIKCAVLRITNRGTSRRRLTITAYAEWTLGVLREHTQHQVLTSYEGDSAIFGRNAFDPVYADWVGFHAISEPVKSHTGDRREFIGRNGSLDAPAALLRAAGYEDVLSGTTGAGIDPCSALHAEIELAGGASREVVVLLGAADDPAQARAAIAELRDPARATAAIDATVASWADRLATITVHTPEPSFDAMLNRWTLYQTLSCRMWGRSALYQSGGAYGFRDQLQDAMALVYAEPTVAREHLIRSAGRQFVEGDVQHWWHPETGRGVRTRFSDDLVWLPFVADHYVRVTGDRSVLDEPVPFLTMRELGPGEQELYEQPDVSAETGSIHEHCLRALRRAATVGPHGLPLMGGGDWNDGMNRVGIDGKGESVWLGWFLIATMRGYADRADERGDGAAAAELRARAEQYRTAIEEHAWDGEWYRRAYFDDGTPLGSKESDECKIDSIAQSWSVISAAGRPERQATAMTSVAQHLLRPDARLIELLEPPFDRTTHDPGYIRGYLPGVRENGAQYTHAALWVVLATALLGDGDRAFELYQMINPLTHATTPEQVARYRVEPYVVAADVYTAKGHLGRGGWTWYTGSASWMYRIGLESILGFTKQGDRLRFRPVVPASWPEFSIEYRHGGTRYRIVVREPARVKAGATKLMLDGRRLDGEEIVLVDDGATHEVVVTAS